MRNNLAYKLLALAIALIIWLYVNEFEPAGDSRGLGDQYVTKRLQIPMEVRRVSERLYVSSSPSAISLILEGRRDDVTGLMAAREDIEAYANAGDSSAGSHIIPVVVRIPSEFVGAVRRRAVPGSVRVVLGEKVSRQISVDVLFKHSPPEGYSFADPLVSPDSATAYGSPRAVQSIRQLAVVPEPGDIGERGIAGNFSIMAFREGGAAVRGVEITPKRAYLRLDLLSLPDSRIVYVTTSVTGRPASGYRVERVEADPPSVVVTGPPEVLGNTPDLAAATVSVAGRSRTFSEEVPLQFPEGVSARASRRVKVTVHITAVTP